MSPEDCSRLRFWAGALVVALVAVALTGCASSRGGPGRELTKILRL